jgi:hypothetical protein
MLDSIIDRKILFIDGQQIRFRSKVYISLISEIEGGEKNGKSRLPYTITETPVLFKKNSRFYKKIYVNESACGVRTRKVIYLHGHGTDKPSLVCVHG